MSDSWVKASICLATFNKASYLEKTLESIFCQAPPFIYETIVVDDGSSDSTKYVCSNYSSLTYIRIEREPIYRNPSVARNVAYRHARGDILICQSDEVIHVGNRVIERLVHDLLPNTFSIATVINVSNAKSGTLPNGLQLTGLENQRPYFFLGAIYRSDMYRVGGCDERFTSIGYDDDALANCLMSGLRLSPRYLPDVIGHHQDHPRPNNLSDLMSSSARLYAELCSRRNAGLEPWLSTIAPWQYVPQISYFNTPVGSA